MKHYRTFWILILLFVVCQGGVNYVVYEINNKIAADAMGQMIVGNTQFAYPTIWQTVTYTSSFLLFMPGLLMIIAMTNEYNYKTHRQNVIDGLSRTEFISVKLVTILLLSLATTLLTGITVLVFGALAKSTFSTEGIEYLGYYFLQSLSYIGLGLMLGTLVRRSGLAVILYLVYLGMLEGIFEKVLNHFIAPTGYFLPLDAADTLIPFPALKEMQKNFVTRPEPQYLLIAVGVYLVIYFVVTKWRYEKADL